MNSHKMTVTQTPAAENAGEALEAEAPRFQDGGQHDMQDRGYGSGIGVAQRGAHNPEFTNPERPQVPDFVQDNERESVQDMPNYQKMYGDSENEKGQWRKTAQEAMEELAQMKSELGALRAAQSQFYNSPRQMPAQQPAETQLPDTFFPDKGADDLVEVKDVDAMIRSAIAPAVLQIHQQQQQLNQQYLASQKAAAGITPAVEQRVLAEAPWLQNVPEGLPRIQAMQSYMSLQQSRQQQQPNAPQPVQVHPEQAAARRVTYIESNGQAKPSEQEVPLQQRIAQEFGAAKTAAEKKAVLIKYGMQQTNDWGPDVWGSVR